MALFGDKDCVHTIKAIYFTNLNTAVDDVANDLNKWINTLSGRQDGVIRLHNYESEMADWIADQEPGMDKRREEPFDRGMALAACIGVVEQFVVQHQTAKLACCSSC
jgi:hypothetical protein